MEELTKCLDIYLINDLSNIILNYFIVNCHKDCFKKRTTSDFWFCHTPNQTEILSLLPKGFKFVYFTGHVAGTKSEKRISIVFSILNLPPIIMFSDMNIVNDNLKITAVYKHQRQHFIFKSDGITTKRPKYCIKNNIYTNTFRTKKKNYCISNYKFFDEFIS
jgi:hypothetical protein